MSRTTPLARCIPSSSRLAAPPRRTIFSATQSPRFDVRQGNTTSIDPRIFAGLPEFLPKQNVDVLCEWQSGLWTRLQSEVQNNSALLDVKQKWDRSGLDMTHLVSFTAREPSLTIAFNHASLLLNNSFFLENLTGDPPQEVPAIYKELGEKVEAFAEGIVGGGWLWLVRAGDNHADVDIIPTFASGTLLITNRAQRGRSEMPIFGTPPSSGEPTQSQSQNETSASPRTSEVGPGPLSSSRYPPSRARSIARPAPGAGLPAPLAVLNLFECAYLGEKYGVWGRREYARDWWRTLDWNKVQKRSSQIL